jgi:hypothetical protein
MNKKPMKKYKIAVLDDYQNVALECADWSVLRDRADIAVFQDHMDAICSTVRCLISLTILPRRFIALPPLISSTQG